MIQLCAPRHIVLAVACGVYYHISHGRSPPQFTSLEKIDGNDSKIPGDVAFTWLVEWNKSKSALGCPEYCDTK